MSNRFFSPNRLVKAALIGIMFIISTSANAELLGYRFTDVTGEQREINADQNYINAESDLTVAMRAGVDRRLQVELQDADGRIIESNTSNLIGANDRINFGGGEHYGVNLPLSIPQDGTYNVVTRILGSNNAVIEVYEHHFTLDRTPPEILGIITPLVRSAQYHNHEDRLFFGLSPISGMAANSGFEVNGISDNNGIKRYRFKTIQDSTQAQRYTQWFPGSLVALLPREQLNQLMPDNSNNYNLIIEVEDLAGNITRKNRLVNYTHTLIYDPIPMAVYTGKSSDSWRGMSGYKQYSQGVNIELPFSEFIFGINKDEFIDSNISGIILEKHGGNSYDNIAGGGRLTNLDDNRYIYVKTQRRPINNHGSGHYNHWYGDRYGNNKSIRMNYNSVEGSDLAPVIERLSMHYSDGSYIPSYLGNDDSRVVGYVDVKIEPRSFPIRLTFSNAGSFDVEPGQTNLRLQINRSMTSSTAARVGQTLRIFMDIGNGIEVEGTAANRTFYVNKIEPIILDYRVNDDSLTLEVDVSAPSAGTGYFYDYYGITGGSIKTVSGKTLAPLNIDRHSPELHTLIFDLNAFSEGEHTIKEFTVFDRFNQITEPYSYTWVSDSTPPVVDIVVNEKIASLDEIIIRVTDNIDQNPSVTNARITGGPSKDDVNLATVLIPGRIPTYSLEYPVIFPSMVEGEEYELEVTARDANGNLTREKKIFSYSPAVVALSSEDGNAIRIPARVAAFQRVGGGDVVQSAPLTLTGGAVVAGTYDVYATLRSDAEVPLIINGVRVVPGATQEIMGQHNFSTSGGRLSIPVLPAEDGVVGTSTILVTTTAPNAPVLLADIETWEGTANLTGSSWEPRQVIDPLSFIARPTAETFCSFTTRESESRQSDAITKPSCFLEWDNLPGELNPVDRRSTEDAVPELAGIATDQGPQLISYSLYMFDSKGAKVKVGGGSKTLNVLTALNAVQFSTTDDYTAVNRVLHDFNMRLNQSSGPTCQPTLNEDVARQAGERASYDASRRTCYFEWSQVPSGLHQNAVVDIPQLMGNINTAGEHKLSWKAYIFSPEGYRVAVTQQNEMITMIEPEAPTIELTSDYHHTGNTYIVPQNRNSLGGLVVDALPTDVRLDIKRGSQQVENEVFTAGWGARNRLIRNMRTSLTPVWSETLHSVAASYEKLPEIRTEDEYIVVASPSESVQPLLIMDSTTVLDTDPLNLSVRMRSTLDRDGEYVASEMGEWRVRLLNQQSYSNLEPMTELTDAVNGDVAFEVAMEKLTDAGLRIVAEAHLTSPIEGYERVVFSRPTFVQVLRGGAIDGDITSRQFSGPAPLTAVFQISLVDRLDQQALGEVVWQVSTDDGATWEDQAVDPRRKTQFYNAFDEGEYLLRAFMINGNSGAESYTEQVKIVSYAQPDVEIKGPGVLFVGDTHTYTAEITVPENAVKTAEDAIVEWSLDGGDTWTHTGRELDLFSDKEERFAIRARTRMPEAPELDRDAYNEARIMVNFRNVVAPRVRVRSKTLLEEGNTYDISVSATAPYRGLEYEVKGYFTLPDGTTREGTVIEYVPTLADAEAGTATFTYTAWLDGFEEETLATGSSTSRVWQYVWPEFYVTERVSAPVAPAQVSMSLRHRNGARNLDNPTYEWTLPEGIEELQERGGTTRLFKILEPGTHHVSVNVQDERGHSTLVEYVVELGEPDPFDINLRFTPSNNFMREPLDVRLRPTYRGGHPHDRVNLQRFLVDGEVFSEGANSGVATLNAGRHEIIFEIESNHGVKDQGSIIIDVVENQVPVCELEYSESQRNWIVRATCEDPDGRVNKYHWLVNGEENARTSNRLGILKRDYEDEMPQVVLIAVDDSGGASEPVSLP